MLRLWREEVGIGLFRGYCWLQRGRKGPVRAYMGVQGATHQSLVQELEAILDDPANGLMEGMRVALTVSDTLALVIGLPWNDGIRRPVELNRYAQACLAQAGADVGANWILHTEFRHFGAAGLAYGLPRDFLLAIEQACRARKMHLTSVLPAAAVAYSRFRGTGRAARTGMLLCEERSITALLFDAAGLSGHEVEAVTASNTAAMTRLLRRTNALYGVPARLVHWSALANTDEHLLTAIAAELPDVKLHILPTEGLR